MCSKNSINNTRKVDTIDIMESSVPNIAFSTNVYKQHHLYAYSSQGEIQNHVRTQAHEDESRRLPEILRNWIAIQPEVLMIQQAEAGLAETIEIQPIPDEYQARLSEFAKDPMFSKTFSNFPSSFHLVEVDKLVVPQRTVNLDYVGELRTTVSDSPTFEEMLDMCVSPNRPIAPIQHLELFPNPVHVFSSPNADLRYLGSRMKHLTPDDLAYAQGGQPAAAIITFIGYGVASINAFRVGNRLVLSNGHHRVYALRSLGVTHIPMVIQEVSDSSSQFPQELVGIPSGYLLQHPRPALLKDFFHEDFVLTLDIPKRVKTVTVVVQANQHDIPI